MARNATLAPIGAPRASGGRTERLARPSLARRGRPSATDLAESLSLARQINVNLRAEVRSLRRECAEFAGEVRAHGMRIHLAAQADRPDLALHEAGAIVAAADRHLRQRGGAA